MVRGCWIVGCMVLLCWLGVSCTQPTGKADGGESVVEQDPPKEFDFPMPTAPQSCEELDLKAPQTLKPCNRGKGIFGFWRVDAAGLPAYEYTLDHRNDERARYKHSADDDARSHFHQVGNDRINGIAYNDGYVVLMGQERGVTFMNRFDAEGQHYAGGFSIVAEGEQAWNSAYLWKPKEAKARRVFGVGYFETVTQHKGLRITHRIVAPMGDEPMLIDEVEIRNLTGRERKLRHYNYWDLNRHQAEFQPIRTGAAIAQGGDKSRDAINKAFDQVLSFDAGILQAQFVLREPDKHPKRDEPSKTDFYPAPVFLASLLGAPQEVYTDQATFLGTGGIAAPTAAASGRKGEVKAKHEAFGQPSALIMRHDLTIPAQDAVTLRFAFGYVPQGKELEKMLTPWRSPTKKPLEETQKAWKQALPAFAAKGEPVISREVPWRGYALFSATNYLEYYKTFVTPQGSTYLYLHGFDGAPRDQSLFTVPLVYTRPALARGNLRLIMGLTRSSDGGISYSFHGFGMLEDAVIHKHPSDLDLFFMIALNEYLSATGDRAFLQEKIPFYPRTAAPPKTVQDNTVLDHLRVAFDHLVNFVKLGPNGLIRIWDGDWSDGIVWENAKKYSSDKTIEFGESIPNTQMAVYILPLLAAQIEAVDAALAQQMRDYAKKLEAPLRKQFTGSWFLRAWMRDHSNKPVAAGQGSIDLESQPWGLIAQELLTPQQQATLMQTVYDKLDKDSKIGPTLTPGGMVWPAVSQLMTWAYTRGRGDLAWRALRNHMYTAHAEAFPALWFGIWSGPDGLHSKSGTTWKSVATPMTDWPVMNMNQDAMFLLGTLRVAGVEPHTGGLRIQPLEAPTAYTLSTVLLSLSRTENNQLTGTYHAQNDGTLTLTLRAPRGKTLQQASVASKNQTIDANGAASVPLTFKKGDSISFSMSWK